MLLDEIKAKSAADLLKESDEIEQQREAVQNKLKVSGFLFTSANWPFKISSYLITFAYKVDCTEFSAVFIFVISMRVNYNSEVGSHHEKKGHARMYSRGKK